MSIFNPLAEYECGQMRRALSAAFVASGFDSHLANHLGALAANHLETARVTDHESRKQFQHDYTCRYCRDTGYLVAASSDGEPCDACDAPELNAIGRAKWAIDRWEAGRE